jgi:tetratricopeptide (TPR) repeat protein
VIAYSLTVTLAQQLENKLSLSEYLIHLGKLEIYTGDYTAAEQSLNESFTNWKNIGQPMGNAHVLQALSELALHQENFETAAKYLSDSIEMTKDFLQGNNFSLREFNIERLMIAGKLACALENYPQAARLLAAGEALRVQVGQDFDPLLRTEYEQAVTQTRTALGISTFAEHWADGQTLTEEVAIHEALAYVNALQNRFV